MNKGLNKIEHMKMIQSIIERMSRNSFALKGWVVTLVAGIFEMVIFTAGDPATNEVSSEGNTTNITNMLHIIQVK